MKYIELKLTVLSVTLIAIGFFLFPIVAELLPTGDRDLAEIVGFLLMVALMGVGVVFGIASIAILLFRLRDR